MSLFKTYLSLTTGRGTHLFADQTEVLLNGDGVFGLTADNTTQSKFYYNLNLRDDKAGVVRLESTDDVETIVGYVNRENDGAFITLSRYIDTLVTASTGTEEQSYQTSYICLAYDFDYGSVVYLRQGQHVNRIMVEETTDEILSEALWASPGGITFVSATMSQALPALLRMRLSSAILASTMTGLNAVHLVLTVTVDGVEVDLEGSAYFIFGNLVNVYLGDPAIAVHPGQAVLVSYNYDGGGGRGWNDGTDYLEDFTDEVVDNPVTTTTTTTSTSTTSSTTSTTSTSTTSTSSTSTTSTSTTSTSTTSTSTTSTTTLDDDEIWTNGVSTFRLQVRDGELYLDQTMTVTGFSGIENTDWAAIWAKSLP